MYVCSVKTVFKNIISEFHAVALPKLHKRDVSISQEHQLIVSLIGARRSGKTYVLYSLMQRLLDQGIDKRRLLFVNFEDERLNVEAKDLGLMLDAYLELYPDLKLSECYLFFDEIQNIPGWEKFVRRIYDTKTKHIYVTGSNSKLLSTEIATSLRGRTLTYTIYPLSLSEYLRFQDVETNYYVDEKRSKMIAYTRKFLLEGGFPETVGLPEVVQNSLLQSYFNTMIYRDVIERYAVKDVLVFKFFIKKVLNGVTKPLSVNKVYRDLNAMGYKVSNKYLYDFMMYCNTIFMTFSLGKFSFSDIKQEKSNKKIYAIDTGFLRALDFGFSDNYGKLFENMVALEYAKRGAELSYFADKVECDFIVKEKNAYQAVQVSYKMEDESTRKREIRGLVAACKNIGCNKGLIITFEEENKFVHDDVEIEVVAAYKYFTQH